MKYFSLFCFILLFFLVLPFLVVAFNSSSTNFFVRQDINSLGGLPTSTSFKALHSGPSAAIGVSTSSIYKVLSGPLYTFFQTLRPQYTQVHFHWRNDDGTETTATSATGGSEDTALTNVQKNTNKRLRIEISNEGGTVYGFSSEQFRIEYGLQSGSCASSTYTDVGAVGGDWDMATSSQLTEASDTTNIGVSSGGVTDANNSFLSPNGGQRETTSQAGSLNLPSDKFVELEYAVQALSAATNGGTYCFRVTNAGTSTDFVYSQYPTATLAAGGNSAPTVSGVSLNHGNPITLTPNSTTSIDVNFTVADNDGCSDVFTNGGVTSTVFRSGVGFLCPANNLNCYISSTSTNNCSGGSSANATTTFNIYYFAQATDASSSYAAQNWQSYVLARDAANATGSATSTGVELNTLLGIDVVSTTISYGILQPGTDTGASNQTSSVRNVGNSSTTLQLSSSQTLTFGSNTIATSSQHYATSSFAFGGVEGQLSDTPTTVTGFLLTAPTSTNAVSSLVYWGLGISASKPTGTYSGINVFTAVFSP